MTFTHPLIVFGMIGIGIAGCMSSGIIRLLDNRITSKCSPQENILSYNKREALGMLFDEAKEAFQGGKEGADVDFPETYWRQTVPR